RDSFERPRMRDHMTKAAKKKSAAGRKRTPARRGARRPGSAARKHADPKLRERKLQELKHRLLEISDLGAAGAVLGWDHATYMPKGGAPGRSRQSATLGRIAHEKSVDPALGNLLEDLGAYADTLAYDSDDASLIRLARRDFEKAIKLPPEYVARLNAFASTSYDAWT